MQTTIEQTCATALNAAGLGSYISQARPVVTRLVEREENLARDLITWAGQHGLPEDQARQMLHAYGMHVPQLVSVQTFSGDAPQQAAPPVGTVASAQQQNEGTDPLAQTLARIEQTLNGLTQFARENGYQG